MQPLNLYETRVLGSLIEKEFTTPDQYPLSLNALMLACNQKSNREPVLSLDENSVQDAVDSLIKKGLASEVSFGSRVKKYRQRFGNTEFSEFSFAKKELAIFCVLFLRGPQTAGELRTRTNRIYEFTNVSDVEETLNDLIERTGDNCLQRLPREPGKREIRYLQLFSEDSSQQYNINDRDELTSDKHIKQNPNERALNKNSDHEARISELENDVAALKTQLQELQTAWDELNN